MCVLYKIFFPKGSGHNSFDIYAQAMRAKDREKESLVFSIQHEHTNHDIFSLSNIFSALHKNKIELSTGDISCECIFRIAWNGISFAYKCKNIFLLVYDFDFDFVVFIQYTYTSSTGVQCISQEPKYTMLLEIPIAANVIHE